MSEDEELTAINEWLNPFDGKTYVTETDSCIELCDGCAFQKPFFNLNCQNSPECVGENRADGKQVIWVLKTEKETN